LLPDDAAELESSFPTMVELAVNQHVHLGLAGNPLRLNIVVRERLELEVL
jgi:hypothetical protein